MHRLRLPLAAIAAAAAVLVSGCGGDESVAAPSTTSTAQVTTPAAPPKPWRTFTKRELPRIVLQPKDAPADLRYLSGESGPMSLEDMGLILPRQQRQVRALGFLAARDAVFAAKQPTSDRRVAQRIWLFKKRSGAKSWLAKTRQDAIGLQFSELDAPLLGEESWAARGLIQFGGGQAITHAFRLGNAVFTVLTYGDTTPPDEETALAAAKAAVARAKASS
jgi:hypothetical protein